LGGPKEIFPEGFVSPPRGVLKTPGDPELAHGGKIKFSELGKF